LLKIQDPIDKALFFNSTHVQIGNGRNTPFWEAKWLLGSTPKDIAPRLHRRARFKNRTVHKELHNSNWIRNLGVIGSPELLEEFVTLHMAISSVNLTEDNDLIFWN
jgi:hypothetical protein